MSGRDLAGPLAPGATIGIVGGGQLGRMTAIAAARLGFRCLVLSPEEGCPASHVAEHMRGEYEDHAALAALARASDVVTFEFENVSADGLELLSGLVPVRPSSAVLRISQDRVAEKSFLNAHGIRTALWRPVDDAASLRDAAGALGLPAILKTARFGYDGKGQTVLRDPDAVEAAAAGLDGAPMVLEATVRFAREISVVVVRGADGALRHFDPTENRHRDGILDLSLAPARVTDAIAGDAVDIARRIAAALELIGILAVEMFVDADGSVLVNEIAPRPHNSGHWTLDGCAESQFDMHARAVAGLPLPSAARHSDAVMRNLIGPDDIAEFPSLLAQDGAIPHHYGKQEARPGRKMGHVTWLFPRGALPGERAIAGIVGRPAPDDRPD